MRRPITALALFLLACTDAPGGMTSNYVVTDGWSGDVVVHTAADLDAAPRLELVEQLRIGTLDGPEETQLFRVMDADVVGDELWVLDGGHSEIRVFGLEDGRLIRRVGRRGEGPGEFSSPPSTMDIHGDTVVTTAMTRMNFFDLDGGAIGSSPGMTVTEAGLVTSPKSAGRHWFRAQSPPGMTEGRPREVLYRDSMTVYRTTPGDSSLGTKIYSYPTEPRYIFAGPGAELVSPMFTGSPILVGGSDGHLYYSPADEYRIDVLDAGTGEPVRRLVNTMPLAPITPEMVEAQIAEDRQILSEAEPGPELDRAWEVRRKMHSLPVPESRTVVGSILVSPGGSILVQRRDLDPNPMQSGDPVQWDRHDSRGRLTGRLETPSQSRVEHLDESRIVAVERDELGVEQVVVYRIEIEGG